MTNLREPPFYDQLKDQYDELMRKTLLPLEVLELYLDGKSSPEVNIAVENYLATNQQGWRDLGEIKKIIEAEAQFDRDYAFGRVNLKPLPQKILDVIRDVKK